MGGAVSVSVDTVCVSEDREPRGVNNPISKRRYNHSQRRQPHVGNVVRCAERENKRPPKLHVV